MNAARRPAVLYRGDAMATGIRFTVALLLARRERDAGVNREIPTVDGTLGQPISGRPLLRRHGWIRSDSIHPKYATNQARQLASELINYH
jgi:hypothetical protein